MKRWVKMDTFTPFPPLTASTYRLFHRYRKGVWSTRVRDPSQKPARGVWSAGFSVPVLDSAPPHHPTKLWILQLICFLGLLSFLSHRL
jgi:hypothetical protein